MIQRVMSFTLDNSTRRANELRDRIAGISYELTGSELIALLKESHEIKDIKPLYNRKQKRILYAWGLYEFKDTDGYINFRLRKIGEENRPPLSTFNNKKEAVVFLTGMVEKHWLCQKLCGLYDTEGSCFHYTIRQCNGACIKKESKSVYNARAQILVNSYEFDHENFLVIDKGRSPSERSIVCVEKGIYKGYGYLDVTQSYLGVNDMLECIKPALDNKDIRYIIKSWLGKNKIEKLIKY
jgi:DNA polymerase-3 subunit epsilon